jgi:hypothetical protein
MIKADIDSREIDSLIKKLNRWGDTQKRKTKDNLHEAGTNIETESKLDLTRNNHVDTGRLRSSVHMESNSVNRNYTYSDEAGGSYEGSLGVNPGDMEVYVGTNVEYADKIRKIDDFLFPPAEAERKDLIKRLKKQLSEV